MLYPAELQTLRAQDLAQNGWGGARTHGLRVKSPLLYQLSYPPFDFVPKDNSIEGVCQGCQDNT